MFFLAKRKFLTYHMRVRLRRAKPMMQEKESDKYHLFSEKPKITMMEAC
jgi:hypothetical protein